MRELCDAHLASAPGATRSVDHVRTAWFLVTTAQPLTVRYVLDPPGIPREAFLDEVTAMCQRYLAR